MYDSIQTIRYMGNKNKLLDFIIPEIEKITTSKSIVCDLMSGTNCIGYALKSRYTIYANDVQKYSECIAKALIENNLVNTVRHYIDYKSAAKVALFREMGKKMA